MRIDGVVKNRRSVLLYANGREAEFEVGSGGMKLLGKPQTNVKTKIYSRVTRDNKVITVEQGTNNFKVLNMETGQIVSQLKGYSEQPYCKSTL